MAKFNVGDTVIAWLFSEYRKAEISLVYRNGLEINVSGFGPYDVPKKAVEVSSGYLNDAETPAKWYVDLSEIS